MFKAMITIITTLFLFFCFTVFNAIAADYYYRPACGSDGDGTGPACDSAWNSLDNNKWDSMGGNDNLYLIGRHSGNFSILSGGSGGNYLTVRGDHAAGSGQIDGTVQFIDADADYIKLYELTINGRVGRNYGDIPDYKSTFTFNAANQEITDASNGWVAKRYEAGDVVCFLGTIPNNNCYLISSVTASTLSIDDSGDNRAIAEEPAIYAKAKHAWVVSYLIVENCTIIGTTNYRTLFGLGNGDHITIKNNEFDGADYDIAGAIYTSTQFHYKYHDTYIIEGNYIHNIGSFSSDNQDSHAIGIQKTRNLIITKNHFKDCAAGIVMWTDKSTIWNWEITYNYIEQMDGARHYNQFPGCGIALSSSSATNGDGLIAYNLIVNPINVPALEWAGNGIRNNWQNKVKIYNNSIIGHKYGIIGGKEVDIKNNLIKDSKVAHIYGIINATSWTEDNQLYYPLGTYFWAAGSLQTFSDYNFKMNKYVCDSCNKNSITDDPKMEGDYTLKVDSPIIDSGTPLDAAYKMALDPNSIWPTEKGGGNIVLVDQNTLGSGWEIGAFVEGESNFNSPNPPQNLRILSQ
jgi:hypothetical protein